MTLPLRPFLCFASLCLLPHAVGSQVLGPFQVRVGAGIEHDSNVLRAPRDQERSDEIGFVSVAVKGDKQYGLQRIRLNAEGRRYTYRELNGLDYSNLNYSAAWDWAITPRFQGVLSADRRQYRDVSRYRDLADDSTDRPGGAGGRTDRTELLEGRYLIDGNWRALGGVRHTSSRSREARPAGSDMDDTIWDASPTTRSVQAGLGYEFASGRSVTARLRRGQGDYRDWPATLVSADFEENEFETELKWPITAKTALDARLAYLERNHDQAQGLNFSGPVGHATVSWDVTSKTRLIGGVASDLYSHQLEGSGHVRSTRFFVKPVWKPTARTAVTLRYVRENRRWHGALAGTLESGRRDISQWAIAELEWEPRRNVAVSTTLRHERRGSSASVYRYRASTVAAAVNVAF